MLARGAQRCNQRSCEANRSGVRLRFRQPAASSRGSYASATSVYMDSAQSLSGMFAVPTVIYEMSNGNSRLRTNHAAARSRRNQHAR